MTDPTAAAPAPDELTLQTLYLCNIAYADDITTIPGLILKTPVKAIGGIWRRLWGPAEDSDQSNLAFVAGYFPNPSLGPKSICVTIRGTDVDIDDIWGIMEQVWEDIDGAYQTQLPKAPPNVLVAQGTIEGLGVIETLTYNGETLGAFLDRFYRNSSSYTVPAIVTGHSLGGCLATVVAASMRLYLPGPIPIQPITFAAPTAGNSNFASWYSTQFKTARRFQNTLDIIPMALQNLGGINSIYDNYGLYTPLFVQGSIDIMVDWMNDNGSSYVQPAQGQQILPGAFLINDQNDWYAQALHQHHLATYLGLLTNQQLDETALPQSSAPRARNRKRTRPTTASAAR
jgi:triacylglycerol lipase